MARGGGEGVDDRVGGDGEDGACAGEVAPEDGEVEVGVGAGWGGEMSRHVGVVVGGLVGVVGVVVTRALFGTVGCGHGVYLEAVLGVAGDEEQEVRSSM